MIATAMHAAQEARIQALRSKHAHLARKVKEAQQNPALEAYLYNLKKQKLRVKEQIEGIRESG